MDWERRCICASDVHDHAGWLGHLGSHQSVSRLRPSAPVWCELATEIRVPAPSSVHDGQVERSGTGRWDEVATAPDDLGTRMAAEIVQETVEECERLLLDAEATAEQIRSAADEDAARVRRDAVRANARLLTELEQRRPQVEASLAAARLVADRAAQISAGVTADAERREGELLEGAEARARAVVDQAEGQLTAATQQNEAAQATYLEATARSQETDERLAIAEQRLREADARLAEADGQVAAATTRLAEADAQMVAATNRAAAADERFAQADALTALATSRAAEADERLAEAARSLAAVAMGTEAVEVRSRAVEARSADVERRFAELLAASQTAIAEANAVIASGEAQATQHRSEADADARRIGELAWSSAEALQRELLEEADAEALEITWMATLEATRIREEAAADARELRAMAASQADADPRALALDPLPAATLPASHAATATPGVLVESDLRPQLAAPARLRRGRSRRRRQLVALVGLVAIVAVVIRFAVGSPYAVTSESMAPTLANGQRVFVNKLVYDLGAPERGDVVVIDLGGHALVKRVVGLSGEVLEGRDGQVFVNGRALPEPYLPAGVGTAAFPAIELRSDELFVLGDNRESSSDSRAFGPVRARDVVGRAEMVMWPPGDIRTL